jgi:alcohol dehydrogenase
VLIPTTAGTGSEVTQYIVISVDDKKTTIADPKFSADLALLDPTFTLSMPPKITAGTGIDALSHAIEGMMTIFSNELTNLLATKAVELIWNNIEKAYHRGEDLQARSNLMLASTLAGIVIRNAKTTIGHWVAYSIAHDYKLPHGVSCGIPLPYAMQYNLPACKELFANMALKIELGTRETGKKELALRFIREIRDLIKRVGLPTSLQEIGVPKERLEKLAKGFVADHPHPRNICDMDLERALMFYEWTWKGELEGIDI